VVARVVDSRKLRCLALHADDALLAGELEILVEVGPHQLQVQTVGVREHPVKRTVAVGLVGVDGAVRQGHLFQVTVELVLVGVLRHPRVRATCRLAQIVPVSKGTPVDVRVLKTLERVVPLVAHVRSSAASSILVLRGIAVLVEVGSCDDRDVLEAVSEPFDCIAPRPGA